MVEINELINIVGNKTKINKFKYKRDETISAFLPNRKQLCIVIDGSADLVRYDANGNKNIIERFVTGDVFGEIFHSKIGVNELCVFASSNTTIVKIDYNAIVNYDFGEENNKRLKEIFINLTLKKSISQNIRIEILSKRSMRDKILAYFNFLSNWKTRRVFVIPFSYTDLADYLSVDRSSMTREIKNLEVEGFIKKEGKRITLKY